MRKVRLTHAAEADLDGIFEHTLEYHGLRQARAYWAGMKAALDVLTQHPLIGSDQSDIRPDIRRLVHEAHTIYYKVGQDDIVIVRILGPGQDPLEEL